MLHFPPILESSSCSQLCTCKHALVPLEASRGKTSLWPDAGLVHHQFSFHSWQTEVQDELCWKEPLLAQSWQWLWGGILTSGICPCAWNLLMFCIFQPSNVSRALLTIQFHGLGLGFSVICLCVCLKPCWYWERRSHFRHEGKILVQIKNWIWAS